MGTSHPSRDSQTSAMWLKMETKFLERAGPRGRNGSWGCLGPGFLADPIKGNGSGTYSVWRSEARFLGAILFNPHSNPVGKGWRRGSQQPTELSALRVFPGRPQQELLEASCLPLSFKTRHRAVILPTCVLPLKCLFNVFREKERGRGTLM